MLSKLISNRFFHDNSIKLISDNVYPSLKIERFVKLNKFLNKNELYSSKNICFQWVLSFYLQS